MALYCAACDAPHDLDLTPDTGECGVCGGALIEGEGDRGRVGPDAVADRLITAVSDGLAGIAIARGKAPRGAN